MTNQTKLTKNFTQVANSFLESESLSSDEKMVIIIISSYNPCFVSDITIAKFMKVSSKTVQRNRESLIKKGYLKVIRKQGRSNVYETAYEPIFMDCKSNISMDTESIMDTPSIKTKTLWTSENNIMDTDDNLNGHPCPPNNTNITILNNNTKEDNNTNTESESKALEIVEAEAAILSNKQTPALKSLSEQMAEDLKELNLQTEHKPRPVEYITLREAALLNPEALKSILLFWKGSTWEQKIALVFDKPYRTLLNYIDENLQWLHYQSLKDELRLLSENTIDQLEKQKLLK